MPMSFCRHLVVNDKKNSELMVVVKEEVRITEVITAHGLGAMYACTNVWIVNLPNRC